jgi:hypothetical protein
VVGLLEEVMGLDGYARGLGDCKCYVISITIKLRGTLEGLRLGVFLWRNLVRYIFIYKFFLEIVSYSYSLVLMYYS